MSSVSICVSGNRSYNGWVWYNCSVSTKEVASPMVGIGEQSALIKDLYQGAILEIMEEKRIERALYRPDHDLAPDATFVEAVQYTHWYVVNPQGHEPHYRYRRYQQTLRLLANSGRPQVHVDIGCGAGLFSWAILDWATAKGIEHKRVRLFGLDINRSSLRLAKQIRSRLTSDVSPYPNLHYYSNAEALSSNLQERHGKGSDYVITFGYVLVQLVQAQALGEIQRFGDVIGTVLDVLESGCNCTLIAVDSFSGQGTQRLGIGWSLLLESLNRFGIRSSERSVAYSSLNPSDSRRLADLYPPSR